MLAILLVWACPVFFPGNAGAAEKDYPKPEISQICSAIKSAALTHDLPPDFFARLIWKESRFDHLALSPAGAMGIAQFMPATAKEQGLDDPYDFKQAIPASAKLLKELRGEFGNLGAAAAAYNAGPARVHSWRSFKRYLPLETEDYVLDITGESAEHFRDRNRKILQRPLDEKEGFDVACLRLPVILSRSVAMAEVTTKPWGIQIAGNFRRSIAIRSMKRLQRSVPELRKYKTYVQRSKTPRGRAAIFAVRIGADTRSEADRICRSLRRQGGACVVTRN